MRRCTCCHYNIYMFVSLGRGGVGEIFLDQGRAVHFLQTMKGLIFVHASLANIFNKCHIKDIFMNNNCSWVYII